MELAEICRLTKRLHISRRFELFPENCVYRRRFGCKTHFLLHNDKCSSCYIMEYSLSHHLHGKLVYMCVTHVHLTVLDV